LWYNTKIFEKISELIGETNMNDHESKIPHLPPIHPKRAPRTPAEIRQAYLKKYEELIKLRKLTSATPKSDEELAYFANLTKQVSSLRKRLTDAEIENREIEAAITNLDSKRESQKKV
jgi:hypothetical protein